MGQMYIYTCTNCGEERCLTPGVGMGYPSLCERVRDGIAAGEYGPKLKEAQAASPLSGVCAEEHLYVCPQCGRWEVLPDATLYEPLEVEAALDEPFGDQTLREWGFIPYLMSYELKDYRIIAAYAPTCSCGATMRKARRVRGRKLACPVCGTINTVSEEMGFWD